MFENKKWGGRALRIAVGIILVILLAGGAGASTPSIIKISPTAMNIETIGSIAQTFYITVGQTANVTWYINSNPVNNSGIIPAFTVISYTNTPSSSGTYNVSVTATNVNGTDTEYWTWTVHPRTYAAGNRIWDGSRPDLFSLKYTWNPMSFSGFYYDINSDVGNESITMTMNSYTDRTINEGNIVYDTTPEEVGFGYSGFGSYQVIGFMADKYFAGYTANTTPPNPTTQVVGLSMLDQGQLPQVLIDDDVKRIISVGGTLTLQEGYVLKAVDINLSARTMLVELLKDGNVVDPGTTVNASQTYVYTPSRVGAVSNLSIIMVRVDNVSSDVQTASLQGLFQISSNPTSVKIGDVYNDMTVTNVGQDIEMSNTNAVSLNQGSTVNLMGNINILVADNDTFRFALSTQQPTGTFEVRSTVYRDSDPNPIDTWTPYNFGMNIGTTSIGFYYDLDSGVGNETLRLVTLLNGSRTINAQQLDYTTTAEELQFGYSGFGSYQVIGFMADKYFAGYTVSSTPPNPTTNVVPVSTLGQGQLHRVLIDDDTKRTISMGSTLTLQEGYALKAKDINVTDGIMLVSLLKDGNEVDTATLQAGQTYVYTKTVGVVQNLSIIMVRFDSVFSGTEGQAAFLKGMFQISENPTSVKTGDQYNDMNVTVVGQNKIAMSNSNDIILDNGRIEQLMGNIKLKVGDTSATDNALRFYFTITSGGGGNGNTTVGVYRNGVFYLRNSNNAGSADQFFAYGQPGDIPVVGDWNGDNITTVGVYRNGVFYLRNNNSAGFADLAFAYGNPGDIPVVGDWNGDGIDTVGVYRNGVFYLRNSNDAGNADITFGYGLPNDTPVSGDWNGDNITTVGVYRSGVFYLRNTNDAGNADITFGYGLPNDTPVSGDWNGDNITTVGVYRNGVFYLRNNNSIGFADLAFAYGQSGDIPVVGYW
jgi:S-layer protein (TIGR01567 family)